MSKRLEQMRANPADWTISDVEAVCREHGILCEAPRGGGSHYKVAHSAVREKMSIPFKRPIYEELTRVFAPFARRLD